MGFGFISDRFDLTFSLLTNSPDDPFYFSGSTKKPATDLPATVLNWGVNNYVAYHINDVANFVIIRDYDDLGEAYYLTVCRKSWTLAGQFQPLYFKIMTFAETRKGSISNAGSYDNWGKNPKLLDDGQSDVVAIQNWLVGAKFTASVGTKRAIFDFAATYNNP